LRLGSTYLFTEASRRRRRLSAHRRAERDAENRQVSERAIALVVAQLNVPRAFLVSARARAENAVRK
jgi:NACalpha-BTF3-like transcription factor